MMKDADSLRKSTMNIYIEQVQHQQYTSATNMELNFNHPVKELYLGWITGLPPPLTGSVHQLQAVIDTGSDIPAQT